MGVFTQLAVTMETQLPAFALLPKLVFNPLRDNKIKKSNRRGLTSFSIEKRSADKDVSEPAYLAICVTTIFLCLDLNLGEFSPN